MKIIADDGTEFATTEACLAHEAKLPYLKMYAEVEAAVAHDVIFAAKIEALGFRLRRERYERGEKRERKATPPDPTPPSASASSGPTPQQSSESGDGLVQSNPDAREEEAA